MSTSAAYTPPVDQPPSVAAGSASPYGGFWVRLGAHLVDGIIIWLVTVLLMVVAMLAIGVNSEAVNVLVTLVLFIGGQLYHAYYVSSARMATPGKRLCGLYVTDLEGHRIGFGHALGRNLLAFFSYVTLYIGFIMIAFTERKQALHDKMAGTLVHRQPGGSGGVVVAIVAVVFVLVAIVGILAAVAIPQFQDYTVRARVSSVYYPLLANKAAIAEYALAKDVWPTTWEQAGATDPMSGLNPETKQLVEDIRLERDGVMVAAFKIRGKAGELRLAPVKAGNQISWTCTASPEINWFVPPDCRTK